VTATDAPASEEPEETEPPDPFDEVDRMFLEAELPLTYLPRKNS
jgi:hypothetical protein